MLKSDLTKLEYDKILNELMCYCKTYIGKEKAKKLVPSKSVEFVKTSLEETFQSINFSYRKGNIPIYEIADIVQWLKRLNSHNSISTTGLLDVAKILKMSRELKEYFYGTADIEIDLKEFFILEDYFSGLYSNPNIEKTIFEAIIDENTIADNASAKLSTLRRNRRKLEERNKRSSKQNTPF